MVLSFVYSYQKRQLQTQWITFAYILIHMASYIALEYHINYSANAKQLQ